MDTLSGLNRARKRLRKERSKMRNQPGSTWAVCRLRSLIILSHHPASCFLPQTPERFLSFITTFSSSPQTTDSFSLLLERLSVRTQNTPNSPRNRFSDIAILIRAIENNPNQLAHFLLFPSFHPCFREQILFSQPKIHNLYCGFYHLSRVGVPWKISLPLPGQYFVYLLSNLFRWCLSVWTRSWYQGSIPSFVCKRHLNWVVMPSFDLFSAIHQVHSSGSFIGRAKQRYRRMPSVSFRTYSESVTAM